jgi:two-component system NtrC family sensor kinase
LRLILTLTALVAVVEGIFASINIHREERALLESMVRGADQLSHAITNATWHAMLADRRDDAYQVITAIGQQPGIESIRIFNKEGLVTYSTDPHAARQVDKNAEACFLCHEREQPLVRLDAPNRARIYRGSDGKRRMGMVTPVYNEPACSQAACHAHPAEKTVLGVIDVSMGLGPVEAVVDEMKWNGILITLTQFLVIGVLIVFLTRRFVGVPLHKLMRGAEAIGAMDLGERIDIRSPEELRRVGESFNDMAARLQAAMAQLDDFTRELERKVEERSRQLGVAQRKLIQSDRLASLGQLSASVAHEINNPLSGVLNLSMLLQRILREDGIPPERIAEFRGYLQDIAAETTRVGRIVTDLLAFSRRSGPQRAPRDLDQMVRHTISLLDHKLQLGNVRAELELAPGMPAVPCDGGQIQQVLVNLVMNAAEAMPEGGRLWLRTRVEGDDAVIEVEDEGSGIPEAILPRIFDPFFTTKGEGKGVGLGLAVVYGIVDSHGGAIDVCSGAGSGTRFTVRLPLQATGPDTAATASSLGGTSA